MDNSEIQINLNEIFMLFKNNNKKIFLGGFIFSIFFIIYFFLSSSFFQGRVSFYTHYSESNSLDQGYLSSIAALAGQNNDLVFSIDDYVSSKKFLNEIVEKKYNLNELGEMTLTEYYDKVYSSSIILKILKFNKSLQMRDNITELEKKQFFAREALSRKIKINEDRLTKIYSVSIVVKNNPLLADQLINNIYKSIVNYSNEVVNVKASEKKNFISDRLDEVKRDLENSEILYINFLENNKSIKSPNLIVQKERLERKINLYNQLFLSLSDQFEASKIEEKNNTSSFFLLDEPHVVDLRNGFSLLKGLVFAMIAGCFLVFGYILFIGRNKILRSSL